MAYRVTTADHPAKVSTWYTLVIFTASMQEYADPVIDWLDAGRGILGKRFFREVSCAAVDNERWLLTPDWTSLAHSYPTAHIPRILL